jgi:DNA-3-methyladenine glycosylase II
MTTSVITPNGEFSLREAALFGFGHRQEKIFDGVLRMAFVVDGYAAHAGVEVRQGESGAVEVRVAGVSGAERTSAIAQVARILSLDHDAREFESMCERDPVLDALRRVAPGLRPVLFHSPYEAAVWAIISTRRQAGQAAAMREELAGEHGRVFTLAGRRVAAVPTPRQLLRVESIPGLPPTKVGWLHGIARAALDGRLDAATLAAIDPEEAISALCRLAGIGPFYATLIHVRATGTADVLSAAEPGLLALVERLYPGRDPMELGERWRPYRTWAAVLIRAAAGRLPSELSDPAVRLHV